MLTYSDCAHFSDLTDDEIAAIAESHHVPLAIACGEGKHLSATPLGCRTILREMMERIEHAEAMHDWAKARRLHRALDHFAATHHYL